MSKTFLPLSKTREKMPRPKAGAAIQTVVILAGTALALVFHQAAWQPELARYMNGDTANADPALHPALAANCGFILGCGVALAGFAWVFHRHAVSSFGRTASGYVRAAVVVAVLAGLVEDVLVALILHRGPHAQMLIAAAATVKWCAALLGLFGIPATGAVVGRWLVARRRSSTIKRCQRNTPGGKNNWWDEVLVDRKLLRVRSTDPATPPDEVDEGHSSWVNAYRVPGAADVIKRRNGKEVQAICLSGGGVRSACIAMGAMQVFSKADPLDHTSLVAQRRADAEQSIQAQRPMDPAPSWEQLPQPAADVPRLVDEVDYVISVSGGGYAAGARLLAVQPPWTAPQREEAAQYKWPLPLVSQRFDNGSVEFDHFRRGSSYIADSPGALIRALAEVLKNMLLSLLGVFTVPVIIGWLAGLALAHPMWAIAAFVPVQNPTFDTEIRPRHQTDYLVSLVPHPAAWLAIAFFAVVTVLLMMVALVVEWSSSGPGWERRRLWVLGRARDSAVFTTLVAVVTVGLPALMRLCSSVSTHAVQNGYATLTAIAGVIGLNYLSAIAAMVWKKRNKLLTVPSKQSWWQSLLPPGVVQMTLVLLTLTVLVVIWLVTLGSFAAGVFSRVTRTGIGDDPIDIPYLWWEIIAVGVTVLFVGFADVTSLSLHPFYRHRLACTFAVRRVAGPAGRHGQHQHETWRAERYCQAESTRLHRYGQVLGGGPRFIFAAAATLTGRATPAPGLNAVSYVLDAEYVGGPELGWLKTPELWRHCPPRLRRDLTVEAAVAVSGAAFASAMGRQNKGFQKLLAVSGARLGTWLPNPKFVANLACSRNGTCADPDGANKPWRTSLPTIRGAGYFYRELFGLNSITDRLVQVTDGGHYENLGLVEALRRRCRLIICIDGGGDAPPLLGGLGDALRLAEYELGVRVKLDTEGPYAVDNIAPGSGTLPDGRAFAGLEDRITQGTVVAGRITYPAASGLEKDERNGVLIVAKAVLWDGCPNWLLTYAASRGNEAFPHDPTSDQWFNEGQFAAYTRLGRIIGEHAVACAKTLKRDGVISGHQQRADIAAVAAGNGQLATPIAVAKTA